MKESTIIPKLLDEIDAATSSDVDVRTVGGDQDADPPEVIVNWTPSRLSDENGHNSLGGYITDSSGNKVGIEHHTYWQMEADCIARSYSEADRDMYLNDIVSAFVPYENDATAFDSDTREWEVGANQPRENSVIEPDWYEAGVLVTFEYVKRADETGKDTLTDIEYQLDVDESLEETNTETK